MLYQLSYNLVYTLYILYRHLSIANLENLTDYRHRGELISLVDTDRVPRRGLAAQLSMVRVQLINLRK